MNKAKKQNGTLNDEIDQAYTELSSIKDKQSEEYLVQNHKILDLHLKNGMDIR